MLRSREIEAYPERYQETENGVTEVKERTVTVAEQAAVLEKQGWKPLDAIDESKLECEEGFAIRAEAVEYDDHIGCVYKKVINAQYYRNKIQELKEELANTDYQVLKCYEAKVIGWICLMIPIRSMRKGRGSEIASTPWRICWIAYSKKWLRAPQINQVNVKGGTVKVLPKLCYLGNNNGY